MMKNKSNIRQILRVLGFITIIIGLLFAIFLGVTSYEKFIEFVIEITNSPEKSDQIRRFLPRERFKALPFMGLIPILIGSLVIAFQRTLIGYVDFLRDDLKRVIFLFKNLNKSQKFLIYLFLAVTLCLKLYLILKMPIFYDEAWTYLNFTRKGVITSMTYYPVPNNHILHSVLTSITYHLPFSKTINLRLPNLVVSTLTQIVIFFFLLRKFGFKIAFPATLVFSLLFPVLYYSYCSRGYTLVLFAFTLCFFSFLQLLETKDKRRMSKYHFYAALSAIIGFYAVPSFLYGYLVLVLYLGAYYLINRQNILPLFTQGLVVTIIVLILYAPIILVSGVDSLFGNVYVTPIERNVVWRGLLGHFYKVSEYFLYSKEALYLLLLILIFIFIRNFRNPKVILASCILLSAPILMLIHSVIPYTRTWIYLISPLIFLLCYLIPKIQLNWLALCIYLTFTTGLIALFLKNIKSYEKVSYGGLAISEHIPKDQKLTLLTDGHSFIPALKYYHEEGPLVIHEISDSTKQITYDFILLNNENYELMASDYYKLKESHGYIFGALKNK